MTAKLAIISGYLGSGKSTLVNRLLGGVLPGRTAVVVNDFGSINIDADLISSADEDTIELTNGCICCQINDDASRVMSKLAERADLDNVLCEVSGVGDPRQIAQWRTFPGFTRGPLVVCADATALPRLLKNEYVGDTVSRQLSRAETVLITKTDVALPRDISKTEEACRRAAPNARIFIQESTDPGKAALKVFGPAQNEASARYTDESPKQNEGAGALAHQTRHASVTVDLPKPLDIDVLVSFLSSQSALLMRAKGIALDKAGSWQEVQLAGRQVTVRPHGSQKRRPDSSAMVMIAAGPNAEGIVHEAEAELKQLNR